MVLSVFQGLKLIFLLRLCPFIPFNILNYLFGITSINLLYFFLGGFGSLPGITVRIFIGTTLSNLTQATSEEFEGGPLLLGLLVGGTIMASAAIGYMTAVTKRYLN